MLAGGVGVEQPDDDALLEELGELLGVDEVTNIYNIVTLYAPMRYTFTPTIRHSVSALLDLS